MTREPGTPPVALTVAGSDSGGGAGIQADLRTFHAFGVFGTSALTAVTAQNTRGVRAVRALDPEIVRAQIEAVADDLHPAAWKSGMLANADVIHAVAAAVRDARLEQYVLDPVMVAASGDPLLEEEATEALREELLPRATLVTPNLHEAEILTGHEVRDEASMLRAAEALVDTGAGAALVKGGHLGGNQVVDVLHDGREPRVWRRDRIETRNTHGTGCTLSSAVTAALALGRDLQDAVADGLDFTRRALESAPDLGGGSGPLNHWVPAPGGPGVPGTGGTSVGDGGRSTEVRGAAPSHVEILVPEWLPDALPPEPVVLRDPRERMELVVRLSRLNVEHGSGGPFAAAVFEMETGRLVAAGVNRVVPDSCSAAHAEVVALGLAQRRLATHDLASGGRRHELVASTEPCVMCFGAVHWSGVRQLVCGARAEDARTVGFDEGTKPDGWIGVLERRGVTVLRDVAREEARDVLELYRRRGGPVYNPRLDEDV